MRATALGVVNSMTGDAAYDTAANTIGIPVTDSPVTPGAAKALATADTNRLASTSSDPGSVYAMPQVRVDATKALPTTAWEFTTAGMNAWTAANDPSSNTSGATYLWWAQARGVTSALDAWYLYYDANTAELTAGTMTATEV
jgi:hypothetical protein